MKKYIYNFHIEETDEDLMLYSLKCMRDIPKFPGVYFLFDKEKKLIYVGQSNKISNRLSTHFKENNAAIYFSYLKENSIYVRLAIEVFFITKFTPYFNTVYCENTENDKKKIKHIKKLRAKNIEKLKNTFVCHLCENRFLYHTVSEFYFCNNCKNTICKQCALFNDVGMEICPICKDRYLTNAKYRVTT